MSKGLFGLLILGVLVAGGAWALGFPVLRALAAAVVLIFAYQLGHFNGLDEARKEALKSDRDVVKGELFTDIRRRA